MFSGTGNANVPSDYIFKAAISSTLRSVDLSPDLTLLLITKQDPMCCPPFHVAMEGPVDLAVVSSLFLVPVRDRNRISSSMLLLVQGAVIVRYLIQWPVATNGGRGREVCL